MQTKHKQFESNTHTVTQMCTHTNTHARAQIEKVYGKTVNFHGSCYCGKNLISCRVTNIDRSKEITREIDMHFSSPKIRKMHDIIGIFLYTFSNLGRSLYCPQSTKQDY